MFIDFIKRLSHPNWKILLVATFLVSACNGRLQSSPTGTPALPSSTNPSTSPNGSTYTTKTPPVTTSLPVLYGTITPSTLTVFPTISHQANLIPVSTSTSLSSEDWKLLPVIPTVGQAARKIYQHGLGMGNDPHAFSKIGDCQSISTYFLTYFDMPGLYNLGPYSTLQETIDWYSGSFSRDSLAVKGGFNAAAILSPLRADPKQCHSNENPVACELRIQHSSVAIISLEEWWAGHPENYEKYMRQIIEYSINRGVVPIIATKADNLEGNQLINQTIASLAHEYDIPLWNFWAAVQPLPNHGLEAIDVFGDVDMFHLTHSESFYSYEDPAAAQSGWSMRNLTALQVLDAVRRGLSEQP